MYNDLRKVFDEEPEVHNLCTGKIQARKRLISDVCRRFSMLKSFKKPR